jgi:tetratricopeptide (TPR) repeat protein
MGKKCFFIITSALLLSACGSTKQTKEPVAFSKADYPYIEKFHEGVRLKQRGQVEEAIRAFEYCQLANPNDDAVQYALSELYLQSQQMTKSMEAIQRAAKLAPDNKWYTQELAYMYFEKGNYGESAKAFQKLVEKEPRNVDWLFAYAESLMRANDPKSAVKVLDKLESQVGLNPELSIEKFRLYRQVKQDENALREIEKALVVYPTDAQLLANLVDYYFEKRQEDKAFGYLIKLSEADPENGNAHLALAQYYDQKGDRKASYAELKKAFSSEDVPLDNKMKLILGMLDTQAKVDPEMFELSDALVIKYPEESKVHALRGDLFLKNDQPTESLAAFQESLKYDDSKYAIWNQVLIMEYEAQDYEKLYADSKKCLALFPTIANVYLLNGIAGVQTRRYAEAQTSLDMGIELVVNDPPLKAEFYAQKAEAHFGLKQVAEGKTNYDKALKLQPKNVLYLNNYAYRLALAKTDLDKAEELIQQAIAATPSEYHFLDTYGWILFQKGDYAAAKTKITAAYELNKEDKLVNEHLGDVSIKLGKTADAVMYWKKAKELGSTNKVLDKKIEKKTYDEPVY